MNTEDTEIVERIIELFKSKKLVPHRRCTNVYVDSNEIYQPILRHDYKACVIAAVLIGTKHQPDQDVFMEVADILGINVVMTIGMAMGFDGGPGLYAISDTEANGIAIGSEIAFRLFYKARVSNLTNGGFSKEFWP